MDKIAVLDFGGQYAHLIANRVRRLGVYSEIFDSTVSPGELKGFKGIIFSGGPASVRLENSPTCDPAIFNSGVPILGICYGHQLMGKLLGGEVQPGEFSEYGHANVQFLSHRGIFEGLQNVEDVWMSHFDQVVSLPKGFEPVAKTDDCPIAAMADYKRNIFGLQFHPEVTHTRCGMKILENFVKLTGAKRDWSIDNYIGEIEREIKEKVGGKKVFLLISGGVDSTVAFLVLAKALGKEKVFGLFVDTGFMRKNEREEVSAALKELGVDNLHVYDAGEEYFEALKEVYEPEEKRKIIGDLFLKIQEKVSAQLNLNPDEWILGQGTIYPDTIESGGTKHADKIKTHHNRVAKIQELIDQGRVIEPLMQLYKDEVRMVGEKLGLKKEMVWRHPFPGPGLAVRCLCAKGEDYPDDYRELEKKMDVLAGEFGFATQILPIKSVGVQGDERSYRHPVVLYGEPKNWNDLNKLSTRLTNQFKQVNRVLLCLNMRSKAALAVHKSYLQKERILTIQELDGLVMNFLKESGIQREVWQCPTVLIPVQANGSDLESVVLRPVCSEEAMTANFYRMDFSLMKNLNEKILGLGLVSGVFYDLTNKPPGTIEWE